MENLRQINSRPAPKNQNTNSNTVTSRVLLTMVCMPILVMSQAVYADYTYRQVCNSPVMVCVGPTGYESCTATTYCHWEVESTGASGPPPGSTPPPQPNPNTGGGVASTPPPPPVNCDVKKAESNLAAKKCTESVVGVKTSSEASCSRVPVTSMKDLSPELAASIGVDGKLLNGNLAIKVGGKVMEEYHPQADCLRGSANAVSGAQASCDTEQAKRDLALAQLGCTK